MQKFKKLCKFYDRATCFFFNFNMQQVLKLFAVLFLVSLSAHVFAADLLQGTETNLLDTLNGTGKKYLYLSEGIVSLLLYIKTKNVMVLVGIIVVAVFFNIMLKIATA